MAFNVRIFGYQGIVQVHQSLVKQYSADSVFLLEEPYLWSQVIAVPEGNGVAVESVVVAPPDRATMLRVELPDARQIRYEVNPSGPLVASARQAGNASPRLSGFDNFSWGAGYTLSMVDAAFYL